MRVLIGCETSGVMRRAFAARGHEAWSCDLLPAEDGSNHHIRGDVRDHLADGWDLLVAHPPCTRLCNSGVRWLHKAPPGRTEAEMWAELEDGVALFSACWRAPVDRVAVENPVMHRHARERMPADLPRPQIVQPWWFGEPFFKATGFYLRGLPPLVATDRLTPPKAGTEEHKRWSAVHRAPPGPDRWKFRSRTFAGVSKRGNATFFAPDVTPEGARLGERIKRIADPAERAAASAAAPWPDAHQVADWARTDHGGRQYSWIIDHEDDGLSCSSQYGLCE